MATTQKRISLGLDVGGTRIKAVALTEDGSILEQTKLPSNADRGPQAIRKSLGEAISHFRLMGISFERIGIGCAGSVEPKTGVVRNSPNFSDWHNISVKKWIEDDFLVPAVVENDANCAAFAEWRVGSGRGCSNVVLLTLGTGIGGGLIINNSLFRGSTGTAGELGHLCLYADGKPCPCGSQGCFERYCSATALMEAAPGFSAKEIFARSQSAPFKEAIYRFLKDFSVGLTGIANAFDPDVILIGGGMSAGVGLHLPLLEEHLQKHAFPAVGAHVSLKMTEHRNLSGAMGAALLSFSE